MTSIRDRFAGDCAPAANDDLAVDAGQEDADGPDDAGRRPERPVNRPATRYAARSVVARAGRRPGVRSLGVAGTIIR